MNYVLVGINHKTAPVAVRERLVLPEDGVRGALMHLREHPLVRETALLSTCNRVEIYGVSPNVAEASDWIKEYFQDALAADLAAHSLYAKTDSDAVEHLFGVTASLDSQVVGENQIAKQVREAHQVASDCRSTGPYLNRLFHRALFVAKRIKTETEVGRGNVSVGSAGVALAKRIFGSLEGRKVVLLGAGEIGELVLRHLNATTNKTDTRIVNRNRGKALELERQGLGAAHALEELDGILVDSDILITSLSGGFEHLDKNYFTALMQRRRNEPLFIVDLGVPQNIARGVEDLDNVYVYNIDELNSVASENRELRVGAIDAARIIIAEETRLFYEDHLGRQAVPMITGLNRKFEEIRKREFEKTLAKMDHLSETDRAGIERMTRVIVACILHDPILQLKSGGAQEGSMVLSVIKKIFSLNDEVDDV